MNDEEEKDSRAFEAFQEIFETLGEKLFDENLNLSVRGYAKLNSVAGCALRAKFIVGVLREEGGQHLFLQHTKDIQKPGRPIKIEVDEMELFGILLNLMKVLVSMRHDEADEPAPSLIHIRKPELIN